MAANGETAGLCGREFFEAMKDGAIFINTTRSTVVDEEALVWAMEEKGIRAGLDVFDGEPSIKEGEFESSLAAHPSTSGGFRCGVRVLRSSPWSSPRLPMTRLLPHSIRCVHHPPHWGEHGRGAVDHSQGGGSRGQRLRRHR